MRQHPRGEGEGHKTRPKESIFSPSYGINKSRNRVLSVFGIRYSESVSHPEARVDVEVRLGSAAGHAGAGFFFGRIVVVLPRRLHKVHRVE